MPAKPTPFSTRSLLLAALLALTATASAQNLGYTLTDLGLLNGTTDCQAAGLNNKGQVVGGCVSNEDIPGQFSNYAAFVYHDGIMRGLGTLPGDDSSFARAINDNGWVIGSSSRAFKTTPPQPISQGFLYRDNAISRLNIPSGDGEGSFLTGINANGQILGFSFAAVRGSPSVGFLYSNGETTFLDFDPSALNNKGQIVGNKSGRSTVLYSNGISAVLDAYADMFAQPPSAINDQGQIVGKTTIVYGPKIGTSPYGSWGQNVAYLYSQGTFSYLGFLPGYNESYPSAINNLGQVVGVASYDGPPPPACTGGLINLSLILDCRSTITKPTKAFLYTDGRMLDINSLLSPEQAAQYAITGASGINNSGQIAATASVSGHDRAVLLTPNSQTQVRNQQPQNLGTFEASALADGSALAASFEPGPVTKKNGQVFVVALVPTAQGGGTFFMDNRGNWKPFNTCANAPAYTAPGPLTALADINVLGNTIQLSHTGITLYLGYGLASATDPAGTACDDMLKNRNFFPIYTL